MLFALQIENIDPPRNTLKILVQCDMSTVRNLAVQDSLKFITIRESNSNAVLLFFRFFQITSNSAESFGLRKLDYGCLYWHVLLAHIKMYIRVALNLSYK